jgi:hypothetical protein
VAQKLAFCVGLGVRCELGEKALFCLLTSRGRRTLKRPVSCDIWVRFVVANGVI